MNSIAIREQEIIEEFSTLDGDLEMTLQYLMELGERLPALPESDRNDENLVKGCQSKVWLKFSRTDNAMHFEADSNTAITKGLVSLLVRVFNGSTPEEVLGTTITFPEKIGMHRFIGTQRSNGFAAMIKQIRNYAFVSQALDSKKSS